MGLLSRINDIIRSNLNDLVSKAENPEKLLNQAILDMEVHLRKARQQLVDTIAAEKVMEKKRLLLLEQAGRWERRAAMALEAGEEELARRAIVRRNEYQAQADSLEQQVRVQREYVGALKQGLAALEERYRDARARKQALIARARAARARKKTIKQASATKYPSTLAESRAFETFERMEDRVLQLEAQVEAYSQLEAEPIDGRDEVELEARFARMEHGKNIEQQLEQLKQKVKGGNQ
ncbi:MAG: PspA/IM30 family protein [Deltaproteobacteria bacterium]|nr:MAG: PspA/IM30 family protein [Deltaproteobacteria bacterium]